MEEGYFPKGRSLLRRVHEEKAVGLLYGQRALCIGALKPLNYVGTSRHTRSRSTPFRRLSHTGRMFEAIFFGSRPEADVVLARVAAMHKRVKGQLPEDAGAHYPAGTPYSAMQPELMLWTVAVLADSAIWFYERLVRPLRSAERNSLWQEYLRFGELFGMPREVAPGTYLGFEEWFAAQLAGDDLHLTDEARYMGWASAFEIPMPWHRQPAKRVHDLVMLGSLPPRVRELYGADFGTLEEALCAAALSAWRRARRAMPRSVTRGSCTRELELVAATERRRIERGQPTPQLPEWG